MTLLKKLCDNAHQGALLHSNYLICAPKVVTMEVQTQQSAINLIKHLYTCEKLAELLEIVEQVGWLNGYRVSGTLLTTLLGKKVVQCFLPRIGMHSRVRDLISFPCMESGARIGPSGW